ncbi:excinuclease ABC subunit UvrC [Microbispora sp. SCL1-1]|uniref:excinuclease ABC subunit UvrC n=1 Tax=Microbispora TaxID=2005 RepID=UPI00115AE97A|nr:excinuclease ABC subunit UvrC [Microbispora sp. SCL1-1]NJP29495.1 excinuclease ABC subunit UvrC [Microbispora sp. CL1-1]TQS05056.1 excinuclease ABC subunit UvrC [Microbispora sp. SCL1-1]
MADPATYRPAPGSIPESPGVYRFRDPGGRVIYVGKAKSLRQRLNSYFADFAGLHPRTQTMLTTAASVDWTVVGTEVEALQLEYSWIKEFDPRFNVKYRDDKSYPYLAVTMGEDFPRVQVMRGAKRKGTRYFGPYSHAWAIRETVDLLLRVFPVRTCSAGVFKRAGQIGRPCLLGYIDKCSAPCVGRVTPEEHRALAEDFCDFMAGNTGRFIKRLEREMREAAAVEEYERAARLRDDIQALQRALEKQTVVLGDDTDCDVIALAEDPLEAAVQVFYVRGGRIRGQRGWVVDKVEEATPGELVEQFLLQMYGEATIPREILVPARPPDEAALIELLSEQRGSRVDLRVPQRGDKKSLMETVERNAKESLAQHKLRRASDLTTRSRALQEIADALDLDQAPLRIECYDVSHIQGENVVASMVVFEDGLARKSEYRRFSIRSTEGDVASIYEVICRRFKRYLEERAATGELDAETDDEAGRDVARPGAAVNGVAANGAARDGAGPAAAARDEAGGGEDEDDAGEPDAGEPDANGYGSAGRGGAATPIDPETGRPRKFAYPPNLVVVDGGPAQAAAAQRALDELGIDDIAVCGLAKRLEEVWLPGDDQPVILPRSSEGLYLLQRVRDEAHRFAITYHRTKRSKSLKESALDHVPGLGPARRQALLRHFGSVKRLREASAEEIREVPGIGRATAEAIVAALRGESPSPAGQGS